MKIMKSEKTPQKHIKIEIGLLIYITYIIFLSITDILALPLYYIDKNEYLNLIIAIALAATLFLAILGRKIVVIPKIRISRISLVFLFGLLVIAFFRSVFPDLSHDVIMARVYWQYPGFQDNIEYNVFPAGFTFFFPLADRIFYYPHMLLGYRMGTLMNYLILVLTYCQLRNLFNEISEYTISIESTGKKQGRLIYRAFVGDIAAFFSITLFYTLADLGTYMVDLTALPILFFLLRVVIKKEIYSNKRQHIFIALLFGLVFALKFTNVIFIVPILILYLIYNWKSLTLPLFVLCIAIAIIPASPYLLYAYTSTGNPVFWTFNSIFKSDYYFDSDFKDTRWGPSGLKQMLLWPLHLIFNPKERVSEISCLPQCYLLLGILSSCAISLKNFIQKKVFYCEQIIIYVFIFTYVCWLISTGYPRYAIFCEMLAVLITVRGIVLLFSSKRFKYIMKASSIFVFLVLCIQCGINLKGALLNEYNWSFERDFQENVENGSFQMNLAWCFKDRGLLGTQEQRDKIDIFYSTQKLHNIMKQIQPEAPIINANYIFNDLAQVSEVKGSDFPNYYLNKVKELSKTNRVFDVILASQIGSLCTNATTIGAYIKDIEYIPGYYVYDKTPLLVEYGFDADKRSEYTDLSEVTSFTINCDETDQVLLSGIGFLDPYVVWDTEAEHVRIYVKENNGKETVVLEKDLAPSTIYHFNDIINLSNFNGEVQLCIEDTRKSGMAHVIDLDICDVSDDTLDN